MPMAVESAPRRNTTSTLIFFERVSCNFSTTGTGISRMIKSVMTSEMAKPDQEISAWMQWCRCDQSRYCRLQFRTWHWKAEVNKKETASSVQTVIMPREAILKVRPRKILR